jgi:hypothetical protein
MRFRLFVAADVMGVAVGAIGQFAHTALATGMVYFCTWGPDCQRFHDIVDETITLDEIGERRRGHQLFSPDVQCWPLACLEAFNDILDQYSEKGECAAPVNKCRLFSGKTSTTVLSV